jgi:pyruvate/2-oxoglutarate dehydrogenase complex dihydrolipoamide acyltransferase (E2) component
MLIAVAKSACGRRARDLTTAEIAASICHRIVDGREAVTFLVGVKDCLADPA